MSIGLKLFWAAIISLLVAGGITLATVGIPSPNVEVRKSVDIEKLLK